MRLTIRRVGNSLGVIIPRALLAEWGLVEGDVLVASERAIRPALGLHARLDELKLRLAVEVVARFPARRIRAHGLANLHRWKTSGAWVSAYDEWKRLLSDADDGELFAAMLGRDERATRLRQSPPYVGMLPREEVARLNEEAAA